MDEHICSDLQNEHAMNKQTIKIFTLIKFYNLWYINLYKETKVAQWFMNTGFRQVSYMSVKTSLLQNNLFF